VFTGFLLGSLKGRDHWEDLGIGGEDNINMGLREIGIDEANWFWVAQDRVHWWVFVNVVMNPQVS
jgi:hypothetical protein